MAKVLTVIVAAQAVSFLLEDGTQTPVIEPGFEFFTADEMKTLVDEQQVHVEKLRRFVASRDAEIIELLDQIRNLKREPGHVSRPLLQEEHLAIPVPRTLDRLAPLDALLPHPSLDEVPQTEISAGEPAEMSAGEPSKE